MSPCSLPPCPVATTDLKLTPKAPESQSAGEGDAQEFILRILSLRPCSQSLPWMKQLMAFLCQRSAYPHCPSWAAGSGVGAEMNAGLSQADEKPQKPAGTQAMEHPSPSSPDSLDLGFSPKTCVAMVSHPGKIPERQRGQLRLGAGGRAPPHWEGSRAWRYRQWGGGRRAPTGG